MRAAACLALAILIAATPARAAVKFNPPSDFSTLLPRAQAGDAAAELAIGRMYETGKGAGRDFDEARKYLESAAEQGLPQAQYFLGQMYARGQGTRFQDFSRAAEWLTRAANQNHEAAQCDLGDLYFNGQGVGLSAEDAYFWYLLAGGHKQNARQQKTLQQKLDRTRQLLDPTQLESAAARARGWKPVKEPQTPPAKKTQ